MSNFMVDNSAESFDSTGTRHTGPENVVCSENGIAPIDLKLCSTEMFEDGSASATIYYFEDQNNGTTYAFYSFDDGSWGYRAD